MARGSYFFSSHPRANSGERWATCAALRLFIFIRSFKLSHHLLKGPANTSFASINGCRFGWILPNKIALEFFRWGMRARMRPARDPCNLDSTKRIGIIRRHERAPFCLSAPASFCAELEIIGRVFLNSLGNPSSGPCADHTRRRLALGIPNCRTILTRF
jgi:hypothetical protein